MADADDSQERTEDPTEKRKKEAREKGQIARSKELAATLVLITAALAMIFWGKYVAETLAKIMHDFFSLTREEVFDISYIKMELKEAIPDLMLSLSGLFILTFVGAVYGNIALGGFNFSWKAAGWKWNKLSPMAGFKRMFGMNGLVELVKSIAKVIVIFGMALLVIGFYREQTLLTSVHAFPGNIFEGLDIIAWAFLFLCLAMVPIAAIDIPWQAHQHQEQMKMSKQQVKDEHKNTEGDPQVKGRIRQLQYQMAQKRMMQDVPQADVVVTNPTHFSVALKYDTEKAGAPIVVAKGVDEMAMHIRKIAAAHEVPMIAVPALTRALYYSTDIGHQIPDKLFMAVAQVLAYVYQLKEHRKGKAKRPKLVDPNLKVPTEFAR